MDKRLNIGLVIDDIDNYFSNQAARGAEQAAKTIDANLFIFPGHYIGKSDNRYSDRKYEYQYNTVFTLPTTQNVDIIYILQGVICSRAEAELQYKFLKSMPDVPVVCLFSSVEGYNSVIYNNEDGLSDLIRHIIGKHHAKDIGFVSGPATNKDADERLKTYKKVLAEYGIPVEDSKIVYGDFSTNSEAVVEELLDKNGHLDAIVFANDSMVVGGYNVLKKRGLIPGKDILIGGFDDDVFALSLEPALTTVEANSASLVYKAVLNAENYINGKVPSDITVETRFIQRNSCGCEGIDAEALCGRLRLDSIRSNEEEYIQAVRDYLFSVYADIGPLSDELESFLRSYANLFGTDDPESAAESMNERFYSLLRDSKVMLSTREKFFNLLQAMQYKALRETDNERERLLINEVFSNYFRRLAFSGILPANTARRRTERMQGVISRRVGETLLFEGGEEIHYEQLLSGISGIGIRKSLLYLFQGNVKHHGSPDWLPPASILLKAVNDDKNGIMIPPEEQQLLRTESIFENEFITEDGRRTMIVSPLFVGADLYGLFVNEVSVENAFGISSVAFQLSVTLRSLFMIEEQNRVKQSLQISLERFIRDNTMLEQIAQKDELTGLYNRRGFISNAEKVLNEPMNQGKIAIICYADMDDLKKINDRYGHDDGDFALCTISQVLRESFRDTDIIGRIGGDEFVALAVTGSDCNVDKMKLRIANVIKRYNEASGKPYPIDMCTGIYKFRCAHNIDIYDVINNADRLLYEEKISKKTGRSNA